MLKKDLIFSSAGLPSDLSEKAKFDLWKDTHCERLWSMNYNRPEAAPFKAELRACTVGSIAIGRTMTSVWRSSRQAHNIARDGSDRYVLVINKCETEMHANQIGRDYSIGLGGAALIAAHEPFSISGRDGAILTYTNLVVPHRALHTLFGAVTDRLGFSISADNEALGLLIRYCNILDSGPALTSMSLQAHATETILDLIGLATGIEGDAAELAGLRGLRAARLQAILARMKNEFTRPGISAQHVSQALGLSVGYVHELLQETGMSFAERILELRLQMTRDMLSDPQRNNLRISEIAMTCGFGDVSYFNRCFRRRFGCTPGQAR